MSTPDRELPLEEAPKPPLYRLVDAPGTPVLERAEVGDEEALVGALFATPELAREFAESAGELGLPSLAGLSPEEAPEAGGRPLPEADYVLVVSDRGTGLFHADDLAAQLAVTPETGEHPIPGYPLYIIADQQGDAPLISVDDEEGELLVAALFTSAESARMFREKAPHLGLPESLGTIEDADGLRRHALVAQRAGARYAVVNPDTGDTEAIPVEELIGGAGDP